LPTSSRRRSSGNLEPRATDTLQRSTRGAVVDELDVVLTGETTTSVVTSALGAGATSAAPAAGANAASECAQRRGSVCDQPSEVAPATASAFVDAADDEDALPHDCCQRSACPLCVGVNVPGLPWLMTSTTHEAAAGVVMDVATGFVVAS
jgi:hypothetical protein